MKVEIKKNGGCYEFKNSETNNIVILNNIDELIGLLTLVFAEKQRRVKPFIPSKMLDC